MSRPLYSLILISCRQQAYISEAISSVLKQTYPNIELIVADDGTPNFDEEAIRDYAVCHGAEKLASFKILPSKRNMGTVKNINRAMREVTGDYVQIFAADDALYDESTVFSMVKALEKNPEEYKIVSGQAMMCGKKLDDVIGGFCDRAQMEEMNGFSAQEQFNSLCEGCLYASGAMAYGKNVFEKFGFFDETYCLVEDWPYHLRITRNGCKINYRNFPVLRHRDGGVSKNLNPNSLTTKLYLSDLSDVYKNEIIPYVSLMKKDSAGKVLDYYDHVFAENIFLKKPVLSGANTESSQEKAEFPLYSFILTNYNQEELLYEAVDSLLSQTYPRMELLVVDDGSKSFDEEKLRLYIGERRKKNLLRFSVHTNRTNLGAIKTYNNALEQVEGKYIHIFDGDDALFDNTTVEKIVAAFEALPEEDLILSTQMLMCGHSLDDAISLFCDAEQLLKLNQSSAEKQFTELAKRCIYAKGATIFRRKAFDIVGKYDETYRVIDDWPFFLKAVHQGHKIIYADIITCKHRDGGVSHTQTQSTRRLRFMEELILTVEQGIMPNVGGLSTADQYEILWPYMVYRRISKANHESGGNVPIGELIKKFPGAMRRLLIPTFFSEFGALCGRNFYATAKLTVIFAMLFLLFFAFPCTLPEPVETVYIFFSLSMTTILAALLAFMFPILCMRKCVCFFKNRLGKLS